MYKKLVNILLILVLSITMLPLKQVGNMLYNNQWTEELNEHSDQAPQKQVQNDKWVIPDHFLHGCGNANAGEIEELQLYVNRCQRLPQCPIGEIHAPPPNWAV